MSKVLTYHNLTHGEHWFKADPYGKRQIESILDPEGGNTKQAPTSIPSPFAQMDLVRTAFANLSRREDLKATNIDFRLVSHCLDIGEMFFNFDRFHDRLNIIAWSQKDHLDALKTSTNVRHRRFGEALQLFLDQDAEAYNFKDFEKLYLLELDHRIIGGTSPSTLFFASPNDLSWVNIMMPNGDRLFDDDYKHLHERDEDFQTFLYALAKAMPEFGSKFKVVNDYLERNLKILEKKNHVLFSKISKLTNQSWYDANKYNDLGPSNDKVCMLTFPLQKRKAFDGVIDSDFTIRSTKYRETKPPLVLKAGHDGTTSSGKPMIYYAHAYDRNTKVPHWYDEKIAIGERELPGLTGVKYPHLVISDFLEPYLIRLVYPIQTKKYFNGNLSKYGKDASGLVIEKDYLLPLKKTFFEYFDTDYLQQTVEGKNVFEMEVLAGGAVKVTLRIPVKSDLITFERIYYPSGDEYSLPSFDLDRNRGALVEFQFSITIFPFIKLNDPDLLRHYRVLLVDRDRLPHTSRNEYELAFLKHDRSDDKVGSTYVAKKLRGDKQKGAQATTQCYVVEQDFDFIQVKAGLANGIILPKWQPYVQGATAFNFALDFGTTNTHVEFNTSANIAPKPFEITDADIQTGTLHDPTIADRNAGLFGTGATVLLEIPNQIFPDKIGGHHEHSFPQRTILAEADPINFLEPTFAMADFNIPFIYEKKAKPPFTQISTNLKWSNYTLSTEAERRVRAFFEQLLFMIRAKVLLNGGSLEKTTLLWFYPSSMNSKRVETLEDMINKLFKKHFTDKNLPRRLSESVAPFYWYKESAKAVAASKPVVSIDIGGGTTDVVVYQDNRPQLLTSFRFAANAIFGDAYGEVAAATNGFVQRYESYLEAVLDNMPMPDLKAAFKDIRAQEKSEDIAAFYFSMEKNQHIRNISKDTPVSFTQMLERDDNMRIVFLVFFTAILYHVAKLLKAKNVAMPRYLTFSGNGSKTLNIVSSKKETLEKLARLIIEQAYGETYDSDGLNIIREVEKPKEVTCRGGLLIKEHVDYEAIEDIKVVLVGTGTGLASDKHSPKTYKDVNNELIGKVEHEVKDFIEFLFGLNKVFNFQDRLGIPSNQLNFYKEELCRDIRSNLVEGLNQHKKEQPDPERTLDETLFFYPLIGSLNNLAYQIAVTQPLL